MKGTSRNIYLKAIILILFYFHIIECLNYSIKLCDFTEHNDEDCVIEAEPLDIIYLKCPTQKKNKFFFLSEYWESNMIPNKCFHLVHFSEKMARNKENSNSGFNLSTLLVDGAIAVPGIKGGFTQFISPMYSPKNTSIYCGCEVPTENGNEIRVINIKISKNLQKVKGCDFTFMGKDIIGESFLTTPFNDTADKGIFCEIDLFPGDVGGINCTAAVYHKKSYYKKFYYEPKNCFKRVYIKGEEKDLKDVLPTALSYPYEFPKKSSYESVYPRYIAIPKDNDVQVDLECSCIHKTGLTSKVEGKMILHVLDKNILDQLNEKKNHEIYNENNDEKVIFSDAIDQIIKNIFISNEVNDQTEIHTESTEQVIENAVSVNEESETNTITETVNEMVFINDNESAQNDNLVIPKSDAEEKETSPNKDGRILSEELPHLEDLEYVEKDEERKENEEKNNIEKDCESNYTFPNHNETKSINCKADKDNIEINNNKKNLELLGRDINEALEMDNYPINMFTFTEKELISTDKNYFYVNPDPYHILKLKCQKKDLYENNDYERVQCFSSFVDDKLLLNNIKGTSTEYIKEIEEVIPGSLSQLRNDDGYEKLFIPLFVENDISLYCSCQNEINNEKNDSNPSFSIVNIFFKKNSNKTKGCSFQIDEFDDFYKDYAEREQFLSNLLILNKMNDNNECVIHASNEIVGFQCGPPYRKPRKYKKNNQLYDIATKESLDDETHEDIGFFKTDPLYCFEYVNENQNIQDILPNTYVFPNSNIIIGEMKNYHTRYIKLNENHENKVISCYCNYYKNNEVVYSGKMTINVQKRKIIHLNSEGLFKKIKKIGKIKINKKKDIYNDKIKYDMEEPYEITKNYYSSSNKENYLSGKNDNKEETYSHNNENNIKNNLYNNLEEKIENYPSYKNEETIENDEHNEYYKVENYNNNEENDVYDMDENSKDDENENIKDDENENSKDDENENIKDYENENTRDDNDFEDEDEDDENRNEDEDDDNSNEEENDIYINFDKNRENDDLNTIFKKPKKSIDTQNSTLHDGASQNMAVINSSKNVTVIFPENKSHSNKDQKELYPKFISLKYEENINEKDKVNKTLIIHKEFFSPSLRGIQTEDEFKEDKERDEEKDKNDHKTMDNI
ncbi:liver specific protein 2, putative [Plasmodium gallinaceum]|uniref:Liver specific protein 2, putative n=1 Tax=Plasmodium gallinaceum TaxID=5849 RepID=A0A1J1H0Z6_PLAGA|nr:liver specific protein 2, putative [Plasmodium gallinaceum]CRG98125.1 liver specific protein 2, putative [Plasmodium gallinaceum]